MPLVGCEHVRGRHADGPGVGLQEGLEVDLVVGRVADELPALEAAEHVHGDACLMLDVGERQGTGFACGLEISLERAAVRHRRGGQRRRSEASPALSRVPTARGVAGRERRGNVTKTPRTGGCRCGAGRDGGI